jgi:hypothetical protein
MSVTIFQDIEGCLRQHCLEDARHSLVGSSGGILICPASIWEKVGDIRLIRGMEDL